MSYPKPEWVSHLDDCKVVLEQEDFPQVSDQADAQIILNYSYINRGASN